MNGKLELELTWIHENYNDLIRNHGGQWLAVEDQKVAAQADRLDNLREKLPTQSSTFILRIPTTEEFAAMAN